MLEYINRNSFPLEHLLSLIKVIYLLMYHYSYKINVIKLYHCLIQCFILIN